MNGNYIGPQYLRIEDIEVTSNYAKSEGYGEHISMIALDPGGVTGWSLIVLRRELMKHNVFQQPLELVLNSKIAWYHGQVDCRYQEDAGVQQLRKLIDVFPRAAIIVEDFILRPARKESSRELLSPVRITAKIEHHLWLKGRRMFLQQPAMAKRITDERLKLLEVYTREGGLQHARDADRHIIMGIRRCMEGAKGVARQKDYWPHVDW